MVRAPGACDGGSVANSDKKSGKKNSASKSQALASTFRAPLGEQLDVTAISTKATPAGPQSREDAEAALAELGPRLAAQQEMLVAQGSAGDPRRVLLVLQGMDTAGKDGVINHVVGLLDPGGINLVSFKKPTAEELAHDFLWRIERQVPAAGRIGVFNRSQYEDVLVVRVHDLVPPSVWEPRYERINQFEQGLVDAHTTVIKCFLHISKDEQTERLLARLDDPTKYWKYNPGDLDARAKWPAYMEAYSAALELCNTDAAPWHVIPADRKWYRNLAVGSLLHDALTGLDPQWPAADFDVAAEKKRLETEDPVS